MGTWDFGAAVLPDWLLPTVSFTGPWHWDLPRPVSQIAALIYFLAKFNDQIFCVIFSLITRSKSMLGIELTAINIF